MGASFHSKDTGCWAISSRVELTGTFKSANGATRFYLALLQFNILKVTPMYPPMLWEHEFVQWLPVAAFVLLGVVFFDKALRRGARRTWTWGRVRGGASLSRKSYAIWGTTFFAITFAVARVSKPGIIAGIAIGLCLISIIVSGFADTSKRCLAPITVFLPVSSGNACQAPFLGGNGIERT
jgi:hypothetical protein